MIHNYIDPLYQHFFRVKRSPVILNLFSPSKLKFPPGFPVTLHINSARANRIKSFSSKKLFAGEINVLNHTL